MDKVWSRCVLASLPSGCVVSVTGTDAVAIINNLTTNDIRKLPIDGVCESFITDVRGWVVAHCMVARLPEMILLIGQFPDPEIIVRHIDRYIVREDATPANRSADLCVFLLDGAGSDALLLRILNGDKPFANRHMLTSIGFSGGDVLFLSAPLTSMGSRLAVVPANLADAFRSTLLAGGFAWCDQLDEIESLRIANFWPLAGREIGEKTLPQELDRDSATISFTKGCYLGQETVARLDARGQLQKKLCLVRVMGEPKGDQDISRDGKLAGHITSVGATGRDGSTLVLAYLKRGNFDPGTHLKLGELAAEVLAPPQLA